MQSDAADDASPYVITPCPADLEKAKNNESYFIHREADEPGETRPWTSIAQCPVAEHCNETSYKKACVWSFEGKEMCLRYLLNHLWNKHHMTQHTGVVCIQCSDLIWEFGQDTYEERETYRVQLEASKRQEGQGSSKKARVSLIDSAQALAKTGSGSSARSGSSAPIMAGQVAAVEKQVQVDEQFGEVREMIQEWASRWRGG